MVLGKILGKVGIPLALVAVAGFAIFFFRGQILQGVQGGAATIGQAITSPIGAFLQGAKTGFGTIPDLIQIPFPRFEFTFGGQTASGSTGKDDSIINPSGQGGFGGSQGVLNPLEPNAFAKALENLRNNTLGILDFTKLLAKAEGAKLTPFNVGRAFDVGTSSDLRGRETREQILKTNPLAIGLFDDPRTKAIEFFPLSAQELTDFTKFGGKLNLSGQIFKELTNDTIF